MSEALSSSEIEDVLSSIRRLVSDDLRPASRQTAAPSLEEKAKLLLTPALRVVQSDPVEAEPLGIDDVLASVSAGVDAQGEEWESETGDQAPEATTAVEAEVQDWSDVAVAAYAEAVLPQEAQDIEDAAEDIQHFEPQPEPAAEDVLHAPAEDDQGGFDQALPGWAQSSATDEDDAPRNDPWSGGTVEPDPAWADEAEAAVLQELTGAAARLSQGADDFVLNESEETELPVDEAMLREIVRDVLREELQGRLGERITRNIRKLVRAEIARVMASEEFL